MGTGFIALMVALVIGVIVGVFIGTRIDASRNNKPSVQGIIYADEGDLKNSPSLFLEARVPIEDIVSRKHVTFEVNVLNNNSRK